MSKYEVCWWEIRAMVPIKPPYDYIINTLFSQTTLNGEFLPINHHCILIICNSFLVASWEGHMYCECYISQFALWPLLTMLKKEVLLLFAVILKGGFTVNIVPQRLDTYNILMFSCCSSAKHSSVGDVAVHIHREWLFCAKAMKEVGTVGMLFGNLESIVFWTTMQL